MDKKYFYEEEFSPDTKKKDVNKEYLEYVNNSEYIGTVEVKGIANGEKWSPGRFGYELPNKDSRGGEYILKNLRLKNPQDVSKISRYALLFGGGDITSFTGEFYSQLQLFLEMDGIPIHVFKDGIPPSTQQKVEMFLEIIDGTDIILLVDKYKGDAMPKRLEYITYQTTSQAIINQGKQVCKETLIGLCPTYFLMANKKIRDIKLYLTSNGKEYTFKLKQDKNGIINLTDNLKLNDFSNYFIDFTKAKTSLSYSCSDIDVIIGSVNSNVLRCMSQMTGVAYSC